MKDYRDVILRPIISEKSMKLLQEENKVTLAVSKKTNKIEVRQAVEHIFHVQVEKVNIINVRPKQKRVGRYVGTTASVKKAIVKLKPGQTIELFKKQ